MKCTNPKMIVDNKFKNFNQKILEQVPNSFLIPCGYCFSCKLRKAKEWSAKCVLEAQEHKYNYFLTLTYEDSNLKFADNNLVDLTGEIRTEPTLVKKDLQDFIKRLRKKHYTQYKKWNTLKYLACGEYGEITKRPHYHMILFSDYPIPDLVQYKRNFNEDMLYTSEYMNKIWKLGYVVVSEFSPATAGYVARYTIKKLYGEKKKELINANLYNKQPEFLLCSKNPALGYNAFLKKKELYLITDSIAFYNKDKLVRSKLPKSYLNKQPENEIKNLVDLRKVGSKRNYINYLKLNNETNYLKLLEKEKLIIKEKAKSLTKRII